jgi:hypothetical protein
MIVAVVKSSAAPATPCARASSCCRKPFDLAGLEAALREAQRCKADQAPVRHAAG